MGRVPINHETITAIISFISLDELNKLFPDFDRYKPNDNFSENSFTYYEKNLIKDIKRFETEYLFSNN